MTKVQFMNVINFLVENLAIITFVLSLGEIVGWVLVADRKQEILKSRNQTAVKSMREVMMHFLEDFKLTADLMLEVADLQQRPTDSILMIFIYSMQRSGESLNWEKLHTD
jgi:hypothetical protein